MKKVLILVLIAFGILNAEVSVSYTTITNGLTRHYSVSGKDISVFKEASRRLIILRKNEERRVLLIKRNLRRDHDNCIKQGYRKYVIATDVQDYTSNIRLLGKISYFKYVCDYKFDISVLNINHNEYMLEDLIN